jgi:hypothetical protein
MSNKFETAMGAQFEPYNIFKHGTGTLVQHIETGETGLTEVRETAPEWIEVFVNWGSGYEPAVGRHLVVRSEEGGQYES